MSKKVILLSLQTFGNTGGIQKMTRTLAYSLGQISDENGWNFKLWSLYDSRFDLMEQYVTPQNFIGFGRRRLRLVFKALFSGTHADIVILSHINLSLLGLLIKIINPACRVWLIGHGIEVWRKLNPLRKLFVKRCCDKIVCVSEFTREQMLKNNGGDPGRYVVLNNAVDPFIGQPEDFERPEYLLNRYKLSKKNQVLFSLTRMASSEQYKGYELVIRAVVRLKETFPNIRYLLAGPYDRQEEARIKMLVSACDVENEVILTGYLPEKELADYFLLADVFVLPSKKEGFGIVFVEALACGLPVICGDADGSVDAIRKGELGTAINVADLDELVEAIRGYLEHPPTVKTRLALQHKCLSYFNEQLYRKNLMQLITRDYAA